MKILYNRSFQLTNCVISGVFWTTAGSSLYRDCTSVFVRNLNRCTKNQVSSERFINVKICAENWIYSHLKNSLKENFCFYRVSFFLKNISWQFINCSHTFFGTAKKLCLNFVLWGSTLKYNLPYYETLVEETLKINILWTEPLPTVMENTQIDCVSNGKTQNLC